MSSEAETSEAEGPKMEEKVLYIKQMSRLRST